ncbi:HlyD family type I secretion periplasmic adaptor subunit [Paracoccus aerodenitrificans]|uniref:HlyD family type I secretion periplasmic adaptor subunit n=1 Tax=Paracoccus aerodenitrificans TaxID=3017781 RepID=UPI0022F054A7|nr:HlyD family type I secretion periplasmic adaptor subunit [Paracoccus aerodenitrificans]WBU64344.1 HlyD family type I secretion periplasmic adaptor subunit [Paracoccus aerodenitrificans]
MTQSPPARQWSAQGPFLLGLAALVILFAGFGTWAVAARISGAVIATGQIEVEQQRQIVQHPDGGVVENIHVRDGSSVQAGDVLIRLDGSLLRSELKIIEAQYYEILARRGRLEAERDDADRIIFPPALTEAAERTKELQSLMDGQASLFDTRRLTLQQSLHQLAAQAEQIGAQIQGISAQYDALTLQRDLIAQELADQRLLLEKGLAQSSRVLALEREAASIDGRIGEILAMKAQAETRQTEISITRIQAKSERREQAEAALRDLGYRELELAERRRALTGQLNRLEITAPVSGIVHELQITARRSVLRPADPILSIVPQDRPLVIGARILPLHIDEVFPGQRVKLRLAAFNSATTPEIDGVLNRVSADALMDETTRTSYYRAEIAIPAEQRDRLGDLALVPGMPVEVYIQTGERSPASYLVKPFTDYFVRAFRES